MARVEGGLRAKSNWVRWAWMALGFVLIVVGVAGAMIPFTLHLLGGFAILGIILILRNSRTWRRRFVRMQHRHPRWLVPVRRVLRGEVWPVLWHEALRTERFVLGVIRLRRWRRLQRWRHAIWRRAGWGRRVSPS